MPSPYKEWCRDYPDDARRKNFAKALSSPNYHPPRPCRSADESHMIRRYVYLWFTSAGGNKPSGRAWAKQLGISYTWLYKLVREFRKDPSEMWRIQAAEGDPRFADLVAAQECSSEMRHRGELRPLRYRWPPKRRRKTDRDDVPK